MADMELLGSIHRIEQDIRESSGRLKDWNEQLGQAVSELPESSDLVDAMSAAKTARENLKQAIQDDKDCAVLEASKEAEATKLGDLREILSHHLVLYRETSHATYLEQDDSSKVRPILVTAKLGKPEYQQEVLPLDAKSAAAGEGRS